jgi:hypothetical protein
MSSVFDLGASPTGAGGKEAGRRRHAGRTWIGAVLHLAALLAFSDGASWRTEMAQARSVRIADRLSFVNSIDVP